MTRKTDITLAIVFTILTLGFILLMIFSKPFYEFSWQRHHNPLSWYIRPLMLLPFCYFAYKKSYAGMLFSVFALATSMMWFPKPTNYSEQATAFLQMEAEYLAGEWGLAKILMALTVPLMFVLLGMAFWRRKAFFGFMVLVITMMAKMLWSVVEGGQSGYAIFPAAITGVVISGMLIFIGKKRGWL